MRPNAVFKDVETPVEVTFKITGLPAQDFLVELHRTDKDGKKVLAERIVHHDGKDRTYSESFPVQMDEVGTQTLLATCGRSIPIRRRRAATTTAG